MIYLLFFSFIYMSNFITRSRSLKSNHKRVVQKKRPSTWTAGIGYPSNTKRVSRYKCSPRISNNSSTKWTDQSRVLSMKSNDYHHHHQENHRIRHTIGTISTLTTQACSDIATLKTRTMGRKRIENIFHTQSTLFLFGFLWFPCWWVGGYWLKVELNRLNLEEKQQMSIHPSLLANGKMCSRILWVSNTAAEEVWEENTVELFHRWNQVMSYVSVVLILLIVSLLVWYYVAYYE